MIPSPFQGPSLDQRKFIPSPWNPERLKQRQKIRIQDFTTDTEELVGLVVPRGHRTKIAALLVEIGVSSLALRAGYGSDVITPPEEILRESSEIARAYPHKTFAVCGPITSDIDRVLFIGSSSVVIQTTTSQIGIEYRLRTDLQSLISKIIRAVDYAKNHGLSVMYMASDSTRAQKEDLRRIVESVAEAGCEGIVLSDSNGCSSPFGIFDHVKTVSAWTQLPISAHCHNDYGLATANALAAIEAGAKYAQTCVAGVGERAGLASFEEVVLSIEHMLGVKTGIEISKLVSLCNEIADLLNYPILPKKPVIGYASICFEGERSVDSLDDCTTKRSRLAMMPYLPEIVGGQEYIFLGAELGQKALKWRLERLNPKAGNLDDKAKKELIVNIRKAALAQRAPVDDEQLRQMYSNLVNAQTKVPLTFPYMLKSLESEPVQMFAGVARRTLAQSNNLMIVEFRFLKGAEVGLHHHPNEQIGYVASGEVEMRIGDKNHRLAEGDSYLILGEVIHGTKAIMDSVLVDIFYPPRKDYTLVSPTQPRLFFSKG